MHTETKKVTYYSGHVIEVDGRRYAPERTCRMTQYGPEYVLEGWWHCSECEGPVYPPCNEEIAEWALQRCPRCGAKVVE